MINRLVLISAVLFGAITAKAQDNYDASLIPKELLPYASSVVRDQQETVDVKDVDETILTVKKAITVLNKNGDDHAQIVIYYDKDDIVKNIKGVVYNELGKPSAKFSQSDFSDESVGDGFSLFNSERVKHYLPPVINYPYTIAYEYQVRTRETLNFPTWWPCENFGEAIEKSSFTFNCKPDFAIRYKENNIVPGDAASVTAGKQKTLTWQISDLKAIRYEPYSPDLKNVMPNVEVVPEKFSYYGIDGAFSDWRSLGKWIYDKLLANRQELPPATIARMQELTKDINDPKLKAKKIYEYVQQKTRYVGVQVGVGGYQPFPAGDVDMQNYGDCKALVNYTQALLKAVNIESWYCVVKSGRDYKIGLDKDFASMDQGDHIILCVPFKNDTTWADCTSQTIPFGYLGDFTDDRNVLACTPEGGKLLHTPVYTTADNLKSREADFKIGDDGAISGNITTVFKGTFYGYRDDLIGESSTEQNKMLQRIYAINNLVIDKYVIKQDKSAAPTTTETITLQAKDYASLTNGKYYFYVNAVNRNEETPKQVLNRHNDVYITRGETQADEITYTIPAGYHPDKLPLNIVVNKPFGRFSATMEVKDRQIIYKREFLLNGGTYTKDVYQDLVDFFQNVADADDYTVSLTKN